MDRVRQFIGEQRGDAKKYAAKVGISTGALSQYLSGKRNPGTNFYMRVAEKEGVNLNWLLKGDGPRYRQDLMGYEQVLRDLADQLRQPKGGRRERDSEKMVDAVTQGALLALIEGRRPVRSRVPILGKVPAGRPGDGGQRWSEYDAPDFLEQTFAVNDPDLIALKVDGTSQWPLLYPGDFILVSPNVAWDLGDLVVVEIDDYEENFLIKRLGRTEKGKVILHSDNFIAYSPIRESVDRVNVRGRVLHIHRTPSRHQADSRKFGTPGLMEFYRDPGMREIFELLPKLDEGHRIAIIEMIKSLSRTEGKEL